MYVNTRSEDGISGHMYLLESYNMVVMFGQVGQYIPCCMLPCAVAVRLARPFVKEGGRAPDKTERRLDPTSIADETSSE